jgi:hypothetical protein
MRVVLSGGDLQLTFQREPNYYLRRMLDLLALLLALAGIYFLICAGIVTAFGPGTSAWQISPGINSWTLRYASLALLTAAASLWAGPLV